MNKLTKLMLAVCLGGFAIGLFATFSGADLSPAWGFSLPLGAVFFGLFLIALMLQNEAAMFDEEEHAKSKLANRFSSRNSLNANSECLSATESYSR